jgi:hypothetical protein
MLITAPAAGNERWNLWEKQISRGPYNDAVAPVRTKMVVAPASATGRKETWVANVSGVVDELESMRLPPTRWNEAE